jgi:BASS family bile acid:Na+ symporter
MLAAISLLSVIIVPATVKLVAFMFASDASITPMAMARLALNGVVLPLGIGIALNGIVPRHAERAAVMVSRMANILLAIVIMPVMLRAAPAIWSLVGNGTLFAIASVTIVGLAAGHLLGGPAPEDRTALALASSTRHPGIALMIGRVNSADPAVAAAVLLFVLVGLIASIPYLKWRKRQVVTAAGALAAHASR